MTPDGAQACPVIGCPMQYTAEERAQAEAQALPADERVTEALRVLWEEIGTYSVECATTGELAPSRSLVEAVDALGLFARAALAAAPPAVAEPTAPPGFAIVPLRPGSCRDALATKAAAPQEKPE